MLAAERGAAANTLAAYRRDLEGAEEADRRSCRGRSRRAGRAGAAPGRRSRPPAWRARLRRCASSTASCVDEGLARGRSVARAAAPAHPPPAAQDPLARRGRSAVRPRRTGSGGGRSPRPCGCWRCSNCSMVRACARPNWSRCRLRAVPRDAPFLTVTGKGGQQRMVPVSEPGEAGALALAGGAPEPDGAVPVSLARQSI